ncbi:MAG: type II secretion system protein [Sulfuricella sp.]|nr:type II secretion system protein [Sulfuricella sp.]
MNLIKLMSLSRKDQSELVASIDPAQVKSRGLKRRFEKVRNKQGGFTLLELLVVVAILAAIAGTATIMLQDTDRKGAAAAHVAMMDELSKGIQTFRVLNGGNYPNNWDSLMQNATNVMTGATPSAVLNSALAGNLTAGALTAGDVAALSNVGITTARVIDPAAQGGTLCDSANIKGLIADKTNNVTAQNIFRPATANGCGYAADATMAAGDAVMTWSGDNQRVNAAAGEKLVAFGVGPDSSLFNPSTIGALSNVPVYRHVANDEYNRFVVLWNTSTAGGQATFQAIVDGAGDTKDEELGEVDNVRRT